VIAVVALFSDFLAIFAFLFYCELR